MKNAMLIGLLIVASLTVQAQVVPPAQLLPNYVVPCEQQAKDAINRLNQMSQRLALTQDSLARCRWVLDTTRRNNKALNQLRLARIDSVTAEAGRKLAIEAELRRTAEVRAQQAQSTINTLIHRLGIEAATDRFLGAGRRAALLRILTSIQF